jgi:hypothetical protein
MAQSVIVKYQTRQRFGLGNVQGGPVSSDVNRFIRASGDLAVLAVIRYPDGSNSELAGGPQNYLWLSFETASLERLWLTPIESLNPKRL